MSEIEWEGRSRGLSLDIVQRAASSVSARKLTRVEPLPGGLRNLHFKLHFEGTADPLVLRFYAQGAQDPSVCRKEAALLDRLHPSVPVPEVVQCSPDGVEGSPPFVLLTHVAGVPLRELERAGEVQALRQAAASAGAALAAIGRYEFLAPGRLGDELEPLGAFVEGPDSVPKFLDSCLASPHFQRRVGAELSERARELAWSWREPLAALEEERRLVHGDFNVRNLLARELHGEWRIAAVLDWEFAFSGSPLFDVGNFLRYELSDRPLLEPGFSRSFVEHGGWLPEGWRRLARVIDLTALCEMLSREKLPAHRVEELTGLVRATIEGRDPP